MLRRFFRALVLLAFAAPASATITGAWRPLTPFPGATRMSHDLVHDPVRGRAVVFGGYVGGTTALNQVLFFDPATGWVVPTVSAARPAPRFEAVMARDPVNDRMILFGGKDVFQYFGDAWELRQIGDSVAWRVLPVAPGPSPRESRMVYDAPRHRMLILCGYGNTPSGFNGPFNEVWALSMDTDPPVWSLVATAGTPPTPRAAHSAVYDPIGDRVLMFGGSDFGFYTNEVWSLDLATTPPTWTLLTPTGTPPAGRYGAVMDLDLARNRLVYWSGFRPGSFLFDAGVLWLDGTPRWEPIAASFTPAARDFAAGYWDAGRQTLVSVGGNSAFGTLGDAEELKLDEQPVAVLASLAEVEATGDRVSLTWQIAPGTPWAELERRDGDTWRTRARLTPGAGDRVVAIDTDVAPGERYRYRLALPTATGTAHSDEVEVSVPGAAQLRFAGATPNPATGGVWVSFELPARGDVSVELYDVNGRRVAGTASSEAAGMHRVRLAAAGELPAGLYFARFRAGGATRGARVIVTE